MHECTRAFICATALLLRQAPFVDMNDPETAVDLVAINVSPQERHSVPDSSINEIPRCIPFAHHHP